MDGRQFDYMCYCRIDLGSNVKNTMFVCVLRAFLQVHLEGFLLMRLPNKPNDELTERSLIMVIQPWLFKNELNTSNVSKTLTQLRLFTNKTNTASALNLLHGFGRITIELGIPPIGFCFSLAKW